VFLCKPARRTAALSAALGLCCASSVAAHDFWVQPGAYWVRTQSVTPMTLQVGHGPFRLRSPIPLRRILRFETIGPSGAATDQRGRLKLGEATRDGDLVLQTPGTYVVVLQTDDLAQTHLPAIRFNDYLKAEGLTPALTQRLQSHRMDADGAENYSRCAKSILQVGPAGAGSLARVTRPLGLPLEIVPLVSPYAEPRPSRLPVQVLYQGRPLAGALIKLTNLENDAAPFETHLTDRAGQASFTMPNRGTWLLNVIWTKVQPAWAETDFATVFSSLSFGFPP
jgi:uncharacterized GH25 family protein